MSINSTTTVLPVGSRAEVWERLRQNSEAIAGFGVSRLGVFGSFVRDEATAESDVDVFVEFEPGMKTFNNFMDLVFFLEDLLGRRVDLLTRASLSPIFGHKILAEVEYVSLS
ncbi:nucleotidyltransferase family protein [Baaleninema sp.]|uniref:nucleotidyltransferase family protein n=1 Tax=Baaleninema sp. TaxID=3101197 RepID=UPI003D01756D